MKQLFVAALFATLVFGGVTTHLSARNPTDINVHSQTVDPKLTDDYHYQYTGQELTTLFLMEFDNNSNVAKNGRITARWSNSEGYNGTIGWKTYAVAAHTEEEILDFAWVTVDAQVSFVFISAEADWQNPGFGDEDSSTISTFSKAPVQ